MLNKILASLTLILLLSLTASLVFWSDDAHPSIITDRFVVTLVKVVAVFVIITSVRLCLSFFNGKKTQASSDETVAQAPRNADMRPAYITIALAIVAPFIPYLGMTLAWSASQSASALLWDSPLWKFSYFYMDSWLTGPAIWFIPMVACYAYIAWSLKNMYMQMKAKQITTRAFAYPAIITGTPFVLLGVGLLGAALGF
jgi:hypothetical protein